MFKQQLLGGIFCIIKDCFRLFFRLLKHPFYVVVLLALFTGAFYLNGIPPQEIANTIGKTYQAFVDNRKKTFSEDMQIIRKRVLKERGMDENIPQAEEMPSEGVDLDLDLEMLQEMERMRREEEIRRRKETEKKMKEEVFGWQKTFNEASLPDKKDLPDTDSFQGILSVIGADTVSINGKKFILKVKLRSGKAGIAFQWMKRQFDGRKANCIPQASFADCFSGKVSLSQALIDEGYADPI